MQRVALAVILTASAFAGPGVDLAAQTATLPYDHVHLNVPDQERAAAFYERLLGGRRTDEAPNRLMLGSTRFILPTSKGLRACGSSWWNGPDWRQAANEAVW